MRIYRGDEVELIGNPQDIESKYILPDNFTGIVEDTITNSRRTLLWFKDTDGIYDSVQFKLLHKNALPELEVGL